FGRPAAGGRIKGLLTREGGSFGLCRSTAALGRSALLSQLGPTPGPARRSLGETGAAMTVGPQRSRDQTYCGTTWTVQNLGPSAQGVGRAHVAHARRHKNDMHEERTHETQSQTVLDRRGYR